MANTRIHIIEDEEDLIDLMTYNLKKEGFDVTSSTAGQAGIAAILENPPQLLLLDLMLPELGGLEICRIAKTAPQTQKLPVIIITAKGSEEDIVKGLEAGADDYIVKPFSPKIAIARINALLRRVEAMNKKSASPQDVLKAHELIIHKGRFEIYANDQKIDLTYSEFHILWNLASKPGWVFTRSQLVDLIRGEDHAITDRAIDVQIVGLRKKLGDYGKYVETVRGLGYKFKE